MAAGAPGYSGREADSSWRKDALQRIEKIRKADVVVKVVDASGNPVPTAAVDVKMQRHAYSFGPAVAAARLLEPGTDGDKYREMIPRLFNRVVMENDLKWPEWERNKDRSLEAVKWLRTRNIEVRGHNLIWPTWKYVPRDVRELASKPEELRQRVAKHIADEVTATRGMIVEWDVINEPFANHDVQDILGRPVMADWFKLARQNDPAAVLFLNDYPILGSNSPHEKNFHETLRFLRDNGAPLGGIGVQCHYGNRPPAPAQLLAGLDALAAFKLPVAATEFDCDTQDEQLQADYVRDHLIAFFSHPATNSVIMWGFWEGSHWKPNAALWRRDWSIKPSGQAWQDLVLKQWWTTGQFRTGSDGTCAFRGFLGDYTITVIAGQRSKTVKLALSTGSSPLTVQLD